MDELSHCIASVMVPFSISGRYMLRDMLTVIFHCSISSRFDVVSNLCHYSTYWIIFSNVLPYVSILQETSIDRILKYNDITTDMFVS